MAAAVLLSAALIAVAAMGASGACASKASLMTVDQSGAETRTPIRRLIRAL